MTIPEKQEEKRKPGTFTPDDARINRAGRPKVPRNMAAILKCFDKTRVDLRQPLPDDWEVPEGFECFSVWEFRLVAEMVRRFYAGKNNDLCHGLLDRLVPSLKALDLTTDGESIKQDRPIEITVASKDVSAAIVRAVAGIGEA